MYSFGVKVGNMNTGIIYMYTAPNGKKYIGQTWHEAKRRWDHRSMSGRDSVFHRAIKKHGKDSFLYEILHSGIATQDELNALECQEIARYNTISPNGYNLTIGGEGGKHHETTVEKLKAIWLDKEKREQIASSMKAAAARPEVKQRLRQNAINNAANPEIMAKRSAKLKEAFSSNEVRQKRSESRKQEWANPEIRERRIAGMKKATQTEEYKKNISDALKKRWQDEDYKKSMSLQLKGKKRPQSAIDATAKKRLVKVVCIEINKVFESVKAASKYFNISHSCISCALTGKQKTAAGYTWRYAADEET